MQVCTACAKSFAEESESVQGGNIRSMTQLRVSQRCASGSQVYPWQHCIAGFQLSHAQCLSGSSSVCFHFAQFRIKEQQDAITSTHASS